MPADTRGLGGAFWRLISSDVPRLSASGVLARAGAGPRQARILALVDGINPVSRIARHARLTPRVALGELIELTRQGIVEWAGPDASEATGAQRTNTEASPAPEPSPDPEASWPTLVAPPPEANSGAALSSMREHQPQPPMISLPAQEKRSSRSARPAQEPVRDLHSRVELALRHGQVLRAFELLDHALRQHPNDAGLVKLRQRVARAMAPPPPQRTRAPGDRQK